MIHRPTITPGRVSSRPGLFVSAVLLVSGCFEARVLEEEDPWRPHPIDPAIDPATDPDAPGWPPPQDDDDSSPDPNDDDGSSFLDGDLPPSPESCDPWDPDGCPEGEKCHVNPCGGDCGVGCGAWCVPAGEDGVGDDCCLAGIGNCDMEGPTGTDSCDATSRCFDVDQDTLTGVCTEICLGPPEAPSCPQSDGHCLVIAQQLPVCVDACDPLAPGECPAGQHCVAHYTASGLATFACYAPGVAEPGGFGDACDCANCCEDGLKCEAQELVGSACDADFCCTTLCDVESPSCPGADQACVPLFDPDHEDLAHVGQCQIPE